MPTGAPEASRRGEEPPDQRQTGLCSMQRPVILLSGLPPDLPDGFIRRAFRPSDRPALPTALPEALAAGSHGSSLPPTLPAGFVSQTFRPPDRQTYRMVSYVGLTWPALPTALPEALAGRVTWVILTAHLTDGFRQPDFPTARPPDLPDGFIRRPYRPSDRPTLPTALPEALAGRVTWVILTGWFYTPDLPAGFVPAARPASLTSSPTGSHTSQPHQPAQPASPTGQPHQ